MTYKLLTTLAFFLTLSPTLALPTQQASAAKREAADATAADELITWAYDRTTNTQEKKREAADATSADELITWTYNHNTNTQEKREAEAAEDVSADELVTWLYGQNTNNQGQT
ncbi:hypothetical protein BU26DRAFT_610502 [Trematosphaeria pertusa]|uniref:Uncharacterized protein n=1 Tax=Trematosphaeria pertusa TaxID=390896 RepID=A0A6A6HVC5_9PLEO|nr:uncharacterized protein BU26DRAFT_610502 [Trematosphaeria pertusa]KAF2242144.1 hypothetical protein BU26DRAFT_610502 [Trematosphaeria pertusa]